MPSSLRIRKERSIKIGPRTLSEVAASQMLEAGFETAQLLEQAWERKAGRQTAYSRAWIEGARVVSIVDSDDPVMRWLERGTGVAGPRGKAFGPKKAKALRFADGTYSMISRGMKPHHYLRDAIREVRPEQMRVWKSAQLRIREASLVPLSR